MSDQSQWLPVATGLERKVNKIIISMMVFSGGGSGLFIDKYSTVWCFNYHFLLHKMTFTHKIIYVRATLMEKLHKRLLLCH